MESNYKQVKEWMRRVEQPTPDRPKTLSMARLELREGLIKEEFDEVCHEFRGYRIAVSDGHTLQGHTLSLAKELADLLVVVYGTFVEMGLDADEVFAAVMENNNGKIDHRQIRTDGKVEVPPSVKKALKARMNEMLSEILVRGYSNGLQTP